MTAACRPSTRATSATDSRLPMPASAPSTSIACPPSSAMPGGEGHLRPQGGLVVDRGDAERSGERLRGVRRPLQLGGQVQHRGLLGRAEVVVGEEGASHAGASVGVVEDPRPGGQERVDVIVADDQGRSEADTVGSRVVHDEAVGERRGGDLGRERTRQVQADEQAPSTDLGHALVGGQPGPETLAHRGGVLEQTVLLDGVEDGEGGGAGHRVPAEGGAVVAGLQEGGRLAEGDAGADRDAAAQPLGDGDDVGVGRRCRRTTRRCGRCRSAPRRARAARRCRG